MANLDVDKIDLIVEKPKIKSESKSIDNSTTSNNPERVELSSIAQLDDDVTLSNVTNKIIKKIEFEKKSLKKKQREIDELTDTLKADVISSSKKSTDFRKSGMSASEKMEKIKAFVELTKSSVDISKSIISITEREHKLMLDSYNIYKRHNTSGDGGNKSVSPTQVAKAIKKMKNKGN